MFRYSTQQIVLHWAVVLLLVFQYLWNEPMGTAFRTWMREGQKSLSGGALAHLLAGVAILLIALWRLALRRGAPPAPHGTAPLDRLAQAVHWLLYAMLIATPATGMIAWIAGIRDVGEIHEVLTTVLLALTGLHVVGALYHQFVLRDGLLNRMRLRG